MSYGTYNNLSDSLISCLLATPEDNRKSPDQVCKTDCHGKWTSPINSNETWQYNLLNTPAYYFFSI